MKFNPQEDIDVEIMIPKKKKKLINDNGILSFSLLTHVTYL